MGKLMAKILKSILGRSDEEEVLEEAKEKSRQAEKRLERIMATLDGEDSWFLCKCEDEEGKPVVKDVCLPDDSLLDNT